MNRVYRVVFLYGLIVFSLSTLAAAAPEPRAMQPLDILNLPSVSAPRVAADGRRVVYIKKVSDWEKNRQVDDLWLAETATGTERQLTFDARSKSQLGWSPDNSFISFVSKRDGDSHKQIHLLPLAGGEAFAVSDHKADIQRYQWSSDGRSLYFLADEPLDEAIEDRKKAKDDMFAFEEPLSYRHIWKLDIEQRTIEKITEGEYFVRDFDLSPDNRFIAFSRAVDATIDARHSADIWTVPSSGGRIERVTSNQYAESRIRISPDNKHILFISNTNADGEYYYDANLFVVTIASGRVRLLAPEQTFEVEAAHWSRTGDSIYILANMGVRSELWEIGLDRGRPRQLTDAVHTLKSWRYNAAADRHVFVRTTPSNPGDIGLLPGAGGELQPVTRVHSELSRTYRLPEQRLVRWQAADGTPLEGLLSLPLDYKKGTRYPTVIHTHGGPRSSDQYGQFRWRTHIPVLAGMGYAYFTINYRGGTGQGDAFMRDMVGGYFNNAHLDVMSGVDHLIEEGIADPDRLLKAGWSAGGHMTNKIITFTDRFKAASSGAGAVDWVSMYGESDTRYGRTDWFGGTPWQQNAPLDIYRKHSPLKDMWKVKTPTLILVGEKDIRVPPTQSMLLYRALRDLGVETKLYIAPRERHGFRELRHRLFKINVELEWFERHARDRAYQWQPAPE
ncbi:S9 family peptidase [Exilibacterium tricleocarpae]|uniref:S9 family peptidase n=1 Tax=Exilibacterium tricleocarpae TaxID=2591008 RepID=A0A545TND8_9GAMM|nr:S9 family peptidase [Exilibacterium tricleocarpae]TQV78742.1 S9 family peptidase [Exilibacterium tricleocarpae]